VVLLHVLVVRGVKGMFGAVRVLLLPSRVMMAMVVVTMFSVIVLVAMVTVSVMNVLRRRWVGRRYRGRAASCLVLRFHLCMFLSPSGLFSDPPL
jgi:hypothetical protein